mgnify:CR=1 FL=1
MVKKYEKQILEAYLNLPSRKLLKHMNELLLMSLLVRRSDSGEGIFTYGSITWCFWNRMQMN